MVSIGSRDVGTLGLGSAKFAFGDVTAVEALRAIRTAVESGVILVDTALAYTRPGYESYAEWIVGRALREYDQQSVFVATKGGHWREGDIYPVDDRPSTLRAHCEISLRSLRLDCLDLYQLHHVDPAVPIEVSVQALQDLKAEGKVANIGLSNVSLDQLQRAQRVAEIASVQNRLSLAYPDDLDMVTFCGAQGLPYLAYSPLGGQGAPIPEAARELADARGTSVAQIMLAWLTTVSPVVIPIVGATRTATILDSIAGASIELSDLELKQLGRVVDA